MLELARLIVEREPPRVGYVRGAFPHWHDDDGDGCNARQHVILRDSGSAHDRAPFATKRNPLCAGKQFSPAGPWACAYTGKIISSASEVDVDHLVPLAEAWDSGADSWSVARRRAFANDVTNDDALFVASRASNRGKADRDPGEWLPPLSDAVRYAYAVNWISVKSRWNLKVDPREKAALFNVLDTQCGGGEGRRRDL